jgi:hypothetical protein
MDVCVLYFFFWFPFGVGKRGEDQDRMASSDSWLVGLQVTHGIAA